MLNDSARRSDFEAQALPQINNLYRVAWYVLDNECDAREVVNISFVRAYRSWLNEQVSPNSRVWLFKIMVNALAVRCESSANPSIVLNSAARQNDIGRSLQAVNQHATNGSGHVDLSAISDDDVSQAVRNLPQDLRQIVVLSLLEGFSYREIADIAGITVEKAKAKLHRGRRLMRGSLITEDTCVVECDRPDGRVRRSLMGRLVG